MKNYKITITGKVRKTGFLFFAKQFSKIYNIKGFVKYTGNTTLLIEAEGHEIQLNKFVEYCKEGPYGSEITGFDITEGEVKHHTTFDILPEYNNNTVNEDRMFK